MEIAPLVFSSVGSTVSRREKPTGHAAWGGYAKRLGERSGRFCLWGPLRALGLTEKAGRALSPSQASDAATSEPRASMTCLTSTMSAPSAMATSKDRASAR
ncbi:hypothetical protein GCM10023146_31020 [Nocardioides caricicola]